MLLDACHNICITLEYISSPLISVWIGPNNNEICHCGEYQTFNQTLNGRLCSNTAPKLVVHHICQHLEGVPYDKFDTDSLLSEAMQHLSHDK